MEDSDSDEEYESTPLVQRTSGAGREAEPPSGGRRLHVVAWCVSLLLLLSIAGLGGVGPQRMSLAAWTLSSAFSSASVELEGEVAELTGRIHQLEKAIVESRRLRATQTSSDAFYDQRGARGKWGVRGARGSRGERGKWGKRGKRRSLGRGAATSTDPPSLGTPLRDSSRAGANSATALATAVATATSPTATSRTATAPTAASTSEPPPSLSLSAHCASEWRSEWGRRAPPGGQSPRWHLGGDLESPGVFESFFESRAPDQELVFLSVGDTRDHRREHKDPELRTISTDFLLNLLANLHALRRDHYVILSTEPLCRKLQREHCVYSCAWSSLWDAHPGLAPWNLRKGDMFLMWAQQWRYIAKAMALGYRVLRADTDVYFAEDPWPIFNSPLFSRFEMLVQHDTAGRAKPRCDVSAQRAPNSSSSVAWGLSSCGVRHSSSALLNIGLVYLRSRPRGGVFSVINGTWARFLDKLAGPPYKPAHLHGKVESQALIDQPFMREEANSLAVKDERAHPRKGRGQWSVVPGDAASAYPAGRARCALPGGAALSHAERESGCDRVAAQRARSAFLVQLVRPRHVHGESGALRDERIALAPDWLFGRGCLTQVENPLALVRATKPGWQPWQPQAPKSASCTSGLPVSPSPGPAAGVLVATHFVYSMALKRKRAFRAFGWDMGAQRNRTVGADGGSCWERSNTGMLFGHTFFTDTPESASILCAMPKDVSTPECSCCVGLPSVDADSATRAKKAGAKLQTTRGGHVRMTGHFDDLQGCNDYQKFWD